MKCTPDILQDVSSRYKDYRPDFKAFVRFVSENGLEMSVSAIEAYATSLKGSAYKAGTINKRLTGAKKLLRFIFVQSEESRDRSAYAEFERRLSEVRGARKSRAVPAERSLTREEMVALLTSDCLSERTQLIVKTLLVTGIRRAELCGIRLSDVQVGIGGKYRVRVFGKGGKERHVDMPRSLVADIRRVFAGTTWLFETREGGRRDPDGLTKLIKDTCTPIVGRKVTPHMFRHTFGTLMTKSNKTTVAAVKDQLGHASAATTLDMYVHDELEFETVMDVILGGEL
jgi:integrase/recombinase XerD